MCDVSFVCVVCHEFVFFHPGPYLAIIAAEEKVESSNMDCFRIVHHAHHISLQVATLWSGDVIHRIM
jgi:hypothetical protein